ncbi:MAG: tetratricopeptide repeat protein, partial [Chitinophagaceae bacterium]
MKNIFALLIIISGVASLHAQSLQQGNQYLYYERYQSAENSFHQALKQNPQDASAWHGLTKAYISQEEWSEA